MTVDCETETPGTFRQVIHVDAHTLHADVAPSLGGGATAPGPHEYFDVSLAACKALTAAWYAKSHHIALDRVEVHIERDATREREGTYVLRVRLAYHGPLTDAERHKLHDIVSRCPVHKLMTSSTVEIVTEPLPG